MFLSLENADGDCESERLRMELTEEIALKNRDSFARKLAHDLWAEIAHEYTRRNALTEFVGSR